MLNTIFGVFIVLHGLVHLLYVGQSLRLFELQPGMVWPDGAWAFSWLAGDQAIRILASVLLISSAVIFAAGGVMLLLDPAWWRPLVLSAAALSTAVYLLLWDGVPRDLDDKGLIGILINLAIAVIVLAFL